MVNAIASMSVSTNKKYILKIFKQQIHVEKLIEAAVLRFYNKIFESFSTDLKEKLLFSN